ncbi:Med1p Ecym_3463 [Eremothecium cymbalariae DBVPG|uniref:Mediator of RNA polymerase II transcription subunit 1 n=1 Tax=Eremothecium cymbalariae (strain CBS 270.75 / DBVPG 7215 / KCTC 17166 / NRRL Y-17582) TaxID=931890 RepID=G8JS27_ERECY|nr:Hypothetical protein Ecym_3463 [Eremothecium cymbalariae DBVPG\
MTDAYFELLGKMITRFVNYKPGSITLENITRLCQTMGLESFVDQVDTNISRLSIASKIIVIDIDYETTDGKVIDVKLVLASNFDKFDYFNGNANILYRSLTAYSDLHEFHHNLKFLTLLDAYSSIDIESTTSQFDLFEYYSVLPRYLQNYLDDNNTNLNVKTNLNDRFGIYLVDPNGDEIGKLTFTITQDPNQRYYEYKYSTDTKEWINESSESYTSGITLLFELVGCRDTYFPKDHIPAEQIHENSNVEANKGPLKPFLFKSYTPRVRLFNDFTVDLYAVSAFQLLNENISLCLDILKWYRWWNLVLYPISELLGSPNDDAKSRITVNKVGQSQSPQGDPPLPTSLHRRSSIKNRRRSSVNEPTMLNDERFQQFTLTEIMGSTVVEDDEDMLGEGPIDLFINEDYVYLNNREICSYYDNDAEKWQQFITLLKQKV